MPLLRNLDYKKVEQLKGNDSGVALNESRGFEAKPSLMVKCRDTTLNPNFLKIPSKVCNVSNARTFLDLLKNNRIDTVAIITLINSVRNVKVSKSQKEITMFSFLSKNKRKSFLDSAPNF